MAVLNATNHRGFRPSLKHPYRFWLALLVSLLLGPVDSPAQTAISKEYQVKAAFLFNFAQFVDWPPDVFMKADAPLCIGVLGADPFGNFLDTTVSGEKIGGHPLIIRRFQQASDVQDCQVLFVSRSEAGQMKQILAALKGRRMLTIGETDGFCKEGGIIRFVPEQNKIRFRICPTAAKEAGLTISSKLLRLAEIVTPGGD